ncbi:MAG: CRISPR-associated endoribonuclease Cas6 [Promethearchaeota archaeon]
MYNFEFTIIGKKPTLLPPFTGHLIRGALLKTISDFDKQLAEKLHEGNKIRPYSISPLFPLKQRYFKRSNRGEIIVEKEGFLAFRLGILSSSLAEKMVKITLQKEEMTINLAGGEFKVFSISIRKTSTAELFHNKNPLSKKYTLQFLTPTYFNLAKQDFPLRFPDPRYLYMNLANLWNSFNEDGILINQEEFFSWVENHVSISGYNLKTRSAYIAKGAPKIGFKGWVHFQLSGEENYQKWIDVLSSFAEYSNVGSGRTAGFGCVKYFPKEINF